MEMFVVVLVIIDNISELSVEKFGVDASFRTVWPRDKRPARRFPSRTNMPFRRVGRGGASGMLGGLGRGPSDSCDKEGEAEEDEDVKDDADADADETVVEE